MNRVYLVEHSWEPTRDALEIKTIGVYSTLELAKEAVDRLKTQPGFADHPEGFSIDPYPLDFDFWSDGFVRVPIDP